MSLPVIDRNKEEPLTSKKRKLGLRKDEPGLNESFGAPKIFKKADPSDCVSPRVFHLKSTKGYIKVVANPGSLPNPPQIFQTNTHRDEVSDCFYSNCFLIDLLTSKSISTDVNERFSNVFYKKKKKEKKKKKLNVKKEEKLRRNLRNNDKWEDKREEKESLEVQECDENENRTNQKDKVFVQSQDFENENRTNQKDKVFVQSQDFENENRTNQKDKVTMSKVEVYRAQGKGLIFHLHHPAKFTFKGEIKITVIVGEVEILGYTLSGNSANAYSPDFCAPLTIETKPLKESTPAEELQFKVKDILPEEDWRIILANSEPNDSIVLVEPILSTFGIVINKYFDRVLFPKHFEDLSAGTETLKSLQSIFNFQLSEKGKHFKRSSDWDKIPLGQVTAICGGKGVGKSTLLKYYVNKLVTLGEKALCLDFDPGQPEFTFPGCLSAVIIDQPLLGPNFTHVIDPVLMMNFGDVDVSHNPSKYLECVKYLIESCRKNEELCRMKWFINTMGFCKGLGVNLIITTLKLLKPNTVIQIKSSDYKNNYPLYLSPVTLNSKSGFNSVPLEGGNLSHDLRVIYSCAEYKKKQLQGGLKPRQLRDIMAVSYFSQMVSLPFYNFNAVQPFLIPFSKLYLGIDFLIDPGDILKAFNGNIVSLSHFQLDTDEILSVESEEDIYFKVIVKPSIAPSLGIGFVRGIDCREKKFYIMTHLPIERLEKVNCLSLGRVNPPRSMFLKQETVEGQTVYTTPGTIDVIQRVKRMFRVPGTPQSKGKI